MDRKFPITLRSGEYVGHPINLVTCKVFTARLTNITLDKIKRRFCILFLLKSFWLWDVRLIKCLDQEHKIICIYLYTINIFA